MRRLTGVVRRSSTTIGPGGAGERREPPGEPRALLAGADRAERHGLRPERREVLDDVSGPARAPAHGRQREERHGRLRRDALDAADPRLVEHEVARDGDGHARGTRRRGRRSHAGSTGFLRRSWSSASASEGASIASGARSRTRARCSRPWPVRTWACAAPSATPAPTSSHLSPRTAERRAERPCAASARAWRSVPGLRHRQRTESSGTVPPGVVRADEDARDGDAAGREPPDDLRVHGVDLGARQDPPREARLVRDDEKERPIVREASSAGAPRRARGARRAGPRGTRARR